MLKKWKSLDDLECVKRYGHNHKMAHMLGTHSYSKCALAIGRWAMEGFVVGLKNPAKITVRSEQQMNLKEIVEQLEWCKYECQAGPLENNTAFIALKELAESEEDRILQDKADGAHEDYLESLRSD